MSNCSQACRGESAITIIGRTSTGELFRPASANLAWNLRIAGWLDTGGRVTRCKQCLVPGVDDDGTPTLRVSVELHRCRPEVYEEVILFAFDNDLLTK